MGYKSATQKINLMWYLPRPRAPYYKGGMPLYCEEWMFELAGDILGKPLDLVSKSEILNVFCGMNRYGFRVDINPSVRPDLAIDTHELSQHLDPAAHQFLVGFADPPYSDKEALELYGLKGHINYKKWTSEVTKFIKPGGLLIVYHKYLMRNPNPEQYKAVARVAVANRTGHLLRCAVFFRKYTEEEQHQRAAP